MELGQGGARGRRGSAGLPSKNAQRNFSVFPLPPFLKAKAIIYSPFRFWECSLHELDVQTPPQGAGEREVERGRPGTSGVPRPSAPLVPAHSGPRRAAARTQKHKSVPEPTVAASSRDPAASPPSPPLKGQQTLLTSRAFGGRGSKLCSRDKAQTSGTLG